MKNMLRKMGTLNLWLTRMVIVLLTINACDLKGQEANGVFEKQVSSRIQGALKDPVFFTTGHFVDTRTSIQFGLQKAGPECINRIEYAPSGDSIFIDFYQPLKVVDGRIDWGVDMGVARVSHHVEYQPYLGLKVEMILSMLSKRYIHSKSTFNMCWDGVTTINLMHTEVDFPTIAGRHIQGLLHALVDSLDEMIFRYPKLLVGNSRAGWSSNPWSDILAERNMNELPMEVLAHRAVRIKTNRIKVANFDLQGTWKSQVKIAPEHGVGGEGLVNFEVDLKDGIVMDHRFQVKKIWGTKLLASEAQAEMELRLQHWVHDQKITRCNYELFPTEAPYDYVFKLKPNNRNEDRALKLYVLSENMIVVRLVNEPDQAVLIKATRVLD